MMNRYKAVIEHYGEKHQVEKAIEELGELVRELWFFMDGAKKENIINNVKTEIADVYNVLEQLKIIFAITDRDVEHEMREKMLRTLKRIEEKRSVGI